MQSLNHYFTGMGLMLMALFEMIGFMYIYGVFALSEDIDFVLDYYPNIFYQITWICIPVALAVTTDSYFCSHGWHKRSVCLFQISIGFDLASVYSARINSYDIMILVVLVIFILLPIILRGIWNVCVYYEDGVMLYFQLVINSNRPTFPSSIGGIEAMNFFKHIFFRTWLGYFLQERM